MEENKLSKKIYTSYSSETDMTAIFEDTFTFDGKVKSTEVRGFYFGKPNKVLTDQYYGELKAIFCDVVE